MANTPVTPFDSIESAHEYIGLLCEAVEEAERAIEREMTHPASFAGRRQLDALRLVDYKLKALQQHFVVSRRLLGDLRTLRRFLLGERTPDQTVEQHASAGQSQPPAAA